MSNIIDAKPRTEKFYYSDFFCLALVMYGYSYIKKFYAQAEAEGMATKDTSDKFRAVVREYLAYERRINIFDANHTLKPLIIEKMDEILAVNKIQTEATFFNFCAHEGLNDSVSYASLFNIGLNYLHMAWYTCHGKINETADEDIERVQAKYYPDNVYNAIKALGKADCFEEQEGERDGNIKDMRDTNVTNCLLFLVGKMKDIYLAVCEQQQAWFERKMATRTRNVTIPTGPRPLSRAERRAMERNSTTAKTKSRIR